MSCENAQSSVLLNLPVDIWARLYRSFLTVDDLVNVKLTGSKEIWKVLSSPGVVTELNLTTEYPAGKAPYRFLISLPHLKRFTLTMSSTSPITQRLLEPLSKDIEVLNVHVFPENYARRWPGWSLKVLPKHLKSFKSNMPVYDHDFNLLPKTLTCLDLSRHGTVKGSGFRDLPSQLLHLKLSVASDSLRMLAENVGKLPSKLNTLELPYMTRVNDTFIENLPSALTTLNLSRVHNITNDNIAKLPRTITHLNLKAAHQISEHCFELLPADLTFFCLLPGEETSNFSPGSISNLPSSISSYTELPAVLQREYTKLYFVGQLPFAAQTPSSSLPRWICSNLSDATAIYLTHTITTLNLSSNRVLTKASLKHLPDGLLTLHLPSCTQSLQMTGRDLALLPRTLTFLEIPHIAPIMDLDLSHLPQGLTHLSLCVEQQQFSLTSKCFQYLPSSIASLELPQCFLKQLGPSAFLFTTFPVNCPTISFGPSTSAIHLHRHGNNFFSDTMKLQYLSRQNVNYVIDTWLRPALTIIFLTLLSVFLYNKECFITLILSITFIPYIISLFVCLYERSRNPQTSFWSSSHGLSVTAAQTVLFFSFLLLYCTRSPPLIQTEPPLISTSNLSSSYMAAAQNHTLKLESYS